MPDGSERPVDPAAHRAQEQMREWREQHRGGGGGIFATIGDLFAAAEAGEFAVSGDTGVRIIKQLTEVQDRVLEMRTSASSAAQQSRLGGGYAEQVTAFNSKINEEGPNKLLMKFTDEPEQLKAAVGRSIGNYQITESGNRNSINRSGVGQ